VSTAQPPPFRPWLIPLIIFIVNVVAFAVLGATGAIENLPPAVQFYFGASTVAFPLIIYLFLNRRAARDGD
jgi:quinol-cytochrome oxidoreductase complex cytochrome b subunit